MSAENGKQTPSLGASWSLFIFALLLNLISFSKPVYASESDVHQYIIGGTVAAQGSWPWAAALVSSQTAKSVFCGGSLIGSKWVLTAAHCVSNRTPREMYVVLGRRDLNSNTGEAIPVSRILVNPNLHEADQDGDIALLELARPSQVTQFISLPTAEVAAKVKAGVLTTVIGWGSTSFPSTGANLSSVLKQVEVPIISNSLCQDLYSVEPHNYNITANMVCAGYLEGKKDSCNGDSGGPLMLQVAQKWYEIGVVSFGYHCAEENAPGVYAKVSGLVNWITSVTGIPADAGSSTDTTIVVPIVPTPPSPPVSELPFCEIPTIKEIIAPVNDSDGDGVADSVELTDGTATDDRGSRVEHLVSPVNGLWNGFLGVTNIAELVNQGENTVSVKVSLLNISGNEEVSFIRNVPPFSQRDIIINDLPGFKRDSYGLMKFEFCGGELDGRISYYRSSTANEFDFAYSIPFSSPTYGQSFVTFNTNQPSASIDDINSQVANWLTVVNLSLSSKRYVVRRFDADGNLLDGREFIIPGGERRDIEAGHVFPGPGNVGLIEVIPDDPQAPYLSQLVRIGQASSPVAAKQYPFAFPFSLRAGSAREQVVPLTTTLNSQNWLEVVNSSTVTAQVLVQFIAHDGSSKGDASLSLPPHSQNHLSVNDMLGKDAVGFAKLYSTNGRGIFANSMVYSLNNISGQIRNVYGSQSSEAVPSTQRSGSFNLFLGMSNWLKIINPNGQNVTANVLVSTPSGIHERTLSIAGNSSIDIGLHESSIFGAADQTLGVFKVTSPTSTKLTTELIRVRPDPADQGVNFIFPTAVR